MSGSLFFARYELLTYLDDKYEAGVLAAVTLGFTGWVLGLIWCLPFTVIRLIINSKKALELTMTPNKRSSRNPAARAAGTKTQCGSAIFALCSCPLA